MSLLKKIAGALLIAFAIFPFFGFPHPKELDFLTDWVVRIMIGLIGLYILGFSFLFPKRNIAATGLFLLSMSSLAPVPMGWRIVLFIYSLDLITAPLVPSIFGLDRIVGRILLIFVLLFLNSFQVTSLLQVDIGLSILLIAILTGGEIIALFFGFLGDMARILIKALIVFVAALFVLNFNTLIAAGIAGGIFVLNLIL